MQGHVTQIIVFILLNHFSNRIYFNVTLFVLGTGVKNWWDNGDKQIAFCRGEKGFIAFNGQCNTDLKVTLQVNMTSVVYWVVAYLLVCRVRRAEGQDEC